MRQIISGTILLMLSLQLTFGQKHEQIQEKMWGISNPAFAITEVPEKWKKESAVIMARHIEYEFKFRANTFHDYTYLRQRIKLQDKNAVQKFSELSFLSYSREKVYNSYFSYDAGRSIRFAVIFSNKTYLGIRIIKPSGKIIEVDPQKEVVKLKTNKKGYEKIAIPNLEVGDILDYYQCDFITNGQQLSEVKEHFFADEYPVLNQTFKVRLHREMFLRYMCMNGFPALKLTNIRGKSIEEYTAYYTKQVLKKNLQWFYPRRSLPVIRFQISRYTRGSQNNYSQQNLRESLFTQKPKWLRFLKKRCKQKYRKGLKKLSKETLVKEMFYVARWWYRELGILLSSDQEPGYLHKKRLQVYAVAQEMAYVLDKYNIKYQFVVVSPRHISPVEQLGFYFERVILLKVENPACWLHLSSGHSLFKTIAPTVQGVKPRLLAPKWEVKYLTNTPISPLSFNKVNSVQQVTLSKQNTLNITRSQQISGAIKLGYQQAVLTKLDIAQSAIKIDIARFALALKHPELLSSRKKIKKERSTQERLARVKTMIEDEYDQKIEKVESFELVQPGRTEEHPNLIFKDAFTLNGFVKKVGPNYIIEAGKLIGGQVEIKENQRKRKYDIYMDYPRSFEHTINFQIPGGYEVKGIDKFNFKVENETGGFISSATKEGNKIIIKSRKFYKHNFEKAEDWGKMVEFLDAAYQFTQQKLLLRKTLD
ncbi:MAG TPA: hypothetical protein DCS93_32205 [Microscillaceae bacterium]|nr:hypothetical protein [Microscillaceae bacterium]